VVQWLPKTGLGGCTQKHLKCAMYRPGQPRLSELDDFFSLIDENGFVLSSQSSLRVEKQHRKPSNAQFLVIFTLIDCNTIAMELKGAFLLTLQLLLFVDVHGQDLATLPHCMVSPAFVGTRYAHSSSSSAVLIMPLATMHFQHSESGTESRLRCSYS